MMRGLFWHSLAFKTRVKLAHSWQKKPNLHMNSLNKLLFFTDFTVTLRATRRALKLVARALKALMNVYHTVFFIIPALQSEKYN
jgi:hypothetical protein